MKPALSSSNRLATLARSINDREQTIAQVKKQLLDKTGDYMAEILLQGQSLLEAKGLLEHGDWETWLARNCPRSARTARDYMRLAANRQRAADFIEAGSVKKSLEMLRLLPEDPPAAGAASESRAWPPYLEAIHRFAKCFGYIERHPLLQWPAEGRDELKQKLEPIAKELWPDKFA